MLSWPRVRTSEAGKYLFRADNVWVEVCEVFCYCILWLDALETIDVCIWPYVCFYVCCSDSVGGLWECLFSVAAVVKNSVCFSLGVLKYVVCFV